MDEVDDVDVVDDEEVDEGEAGCWRLCAVPPSTRIAHPHSPLVCLMLALIHTHVLVGFRTQRYPDKA